jgi:hypothetical protein
MQRVVGWIAALLALAATAVGVWSVAWGWHWPSRFVFGMVLSAPRYQSGVRSEAAQGVTAVAVQVGAASLSVKTVPHARSIRVAYRLPVGVVPRLTRAGSLLTIQVGQPLLSFEGEGASAIVLTLPPDLGLTATVQAGAATVDGRFSRLRLADFAGPITAPTLTVKTLSIHAAAGPVTVNLTRSPQTLSLVDAAGPVTWTGPWPLTGTIRDAAGNVTLQGAPALRTQVTVSVAVGQLTSNFAGLPSGGPGTYTGLVGSGGPGGTLIVTAAAGNVSLMP